MEEKTHLSDMESDILIVEDSPTQAAKLKFILSSKGYPVRVAANGQEALEHVEEKIPTTIISDVLMPGIDGYELCQRIKKNDKTKKIPIVLLTQLSSPKDILRGLECGADHFITKPYDEKYLLSHIQYIIVNKELRKNAIADFGIEISFAGQKHFVTSDRIQIIDLLFSTYEAVMQKNKELENKNIELQRSLETIKALSGLIPICSHCKKIRNDDGYWQKLEEYLHENSEAEFTHGLCPDCQTAFYKTQLKGNEEH